MMIRRRRRQRQRRRTALMTSYKRADGRKSIDWLLEIVAAAAAGAAAAAALSAAVSTDAGRLSIGGGHEVAT